MIQRGHDDTGRPEKSGCHARQSLRVEKFARSRRHKPRRHRTVRTGNRVAGRPLDAAKMRKVELEAAHPAESRLGLPG